VPAVDVTGGTYTGNSVILETTASAATGAKASQTGQIILNGGSVTTQGDNAAGVLVVDNGSVFNGTGLDIGTSDDSAYGVTSRDVTQVTLSDSTIQTSGASSAFGLYATTGSQVTLRNVAISTTGFFSEGLFALDAGTEIDAADLTINTQGDDSYALTIGTGATFAGRSLSITTSGALSAGAYAAVGGVANLENSTVTTTGDGSHGLKLNDGGLLTATNVNVSVTGASSAALYMDEGTLVAPNQLTVNGGRLSASQGAVIHVFGGAGSVTLNGPIVIKSGVVGGKRQFALVEDDAGVASNLSLDVNSVNGIEGAFSVQGVGAGHVVNAAFTGSRWRGDLTVDTGNTANLSLANSTWTGLSAGATDITLDAISLWNVTGSSSAGVVTNAGRIIFEPAGAFSTLTVNSFAGQGGTLRLNTRLGDDASPSDVLVIDGGAASGTTRIAIVNAGGAGAQTTSEGIRVVQTINGATTDPDAFRLAGRVAAGAYEYRLFRGGVMSTEDWFLRSFRSADPTPPPVSPGDGTSPVDPGDGTQPVDPGDEPPPVDPGDGTQPVDPADAPLPADPEDQPPPVTPGDLTPLYRPEAALYAPVPALTRAMDLALIGTLHARAGEQTRGANTQNVWARVIGEYGDGRWSGPVDARMSRSRITGVQLGTDLYRSHDDGQDRLGVYVSRIQHRADIRGFALGSRNLPVGKLTLDGTAAGAYWTHYTSSGRYLDAVIQGHWFDVEARSDYGGGLDASGASYAASLETGRAFSLGGGWKIEPQAQIIGQTLSIDDSADGFSTVRWQEDVSWTGRIGVRLHHTRWTESGLWQPYVKANIWHGFNGADRVDLGSDAIENRFGQRAVEIGIGVTGRVSSSGSLYGHVDHRWSSGRERRSATEAVIGVRFKL